MARPIRKWFSTSWAGDPRILVLISMSADLKEVVAEQALELRLLKKSMIADGGDEE